MDDRELEDHLLPMLVRLSETPLDPNTVAAFVDGEIDASESARFAALIAADPDALLLVRALQEGGRNLGGLRRAAEALIAYLDSLRR